MKKVFMALIQVCFTFICFNIAMNIFGSNELFNEAATLVSNLINPILLSSISLITFLTLIMAIYVICKRILLT